MHASRQEQLELYNPSREREIAISGRWTANGGCKGEATRVSMEGQREHDSGGRIGVIAGV